MPAPMHIGTTIISRIMKMRPASSGPDHPACSQIHLGEADHWEPDLVLGDPIAAGAGASGKGAAGQPSGGEVTTRVEGLNTTHANQK